MFFQVFTYKYRFYTIFLDLICFYSLEWWIIGRKSIEWVILEDDHHRARVESTPTLLMSHIFSLLILLILLLCLEAYLNPFQIQRKMLKKRKTIKNIWKYEFKKFKNREKFKIRNSSTVMPMLELQWGGPRPGEDAWSGAVEVNIVFNDYFAHLRGINVDWPWEGDHLSVGTGRWRL